MPGPSRVSLCTALWALLETAGVLGLGMAVGCAGGHGPYSSNSESARDSLTAQKLTQQAAAVIDADPAKAERLLREALAADLYHGPAHNNLGVLYLKQRHLYEAAGEFEWARKLMPGHPDPRMNLALALEQAGRTDDALSGYSAALECYPDHLPSLEALARLQIKSGKVDDRTTHALQEIALRAPEPSWRDWARANLAKRQP